MENKYCVENLSLSVTDNGVKVTYMEELEKSHEMETRRYTPKEYGFSDKELDKAFAFFKTKLASVRKDAEEDSSEEEED
jgi:hypothetical protein